MGAFDTDPETGSSDGGDIVCLIIIVIFVIVFLIQLQ